MTYQDLKKCKKPQNIRYIRLDDVKLRVEEKVNLGYTISAFVNTQVLILVSCGLTKLDGFTLPNLRYADLSMNEVSEIRACMPLARGAPYLEELQMEENPVCMKPYWASQVVVMMMMVTFMRRCLWCVHISNVLMVVH